MRVSASTVNDVLLAIYRDTLEKQKKAEFPLGGFVGLTPPVDDYNLQSGLVPSEIKGGTRSPILEIPVRNTGRIQGFGPSFKSIIYALRKEYNVAPKYGDTIAKGSGGEDELMFGRIKINRHRFVKNRRVGRWNETLWGNWALSIAQDTLPDLMDLEYRWRSWNGAGCALYYGFSWDIVYDPDFGLGVPPANGGLGITPVLHERICFPHYSPRYVTWSGTYATYSDNLRDRLNTIAGNQATFNGNKMTLATLQIIEAEMRNKLKWGRINRAGQPAFWLAVTDTQWNQLKQSAIDAGASFFFSHPSSEDQTDFVIHNDSFVYGSIRVFRGGWRFPTKVYYNDNASQKVVFGLATGQVANPQLIDMTVSDLSSQSILTNTDNSAVNGRRCGFQVAVGGAYLPGIISIKFWDPEFFVETDDFENKIEQCLDSAISYSRIAWYDIPTLDTNNPSSFYQDRTMLFVTTSDVPDNFS